MLNLRGHCHQNFFEFSRIFMASILGLGLEILGAFLVRPPGGFEHAPARESRRFVPMALGWPAKKPKNSSLKHFWMLGACLCCCWVVECSGPWHTLLSA